MSSEPNKQVEKPAATLRQEITDAGGRKVAAAEARAEFPDTRLGNMARVYTVVGVIGFVVIAFVSGFFMILKNSLDAQETWLQWQYEQQREQARRQDKLWDDVIELQHESYERYLKARELADKRHEETLVKMDKIMLFVELTMKWYAEKRDLPTKGAPAAKEMSKESP